MLKVSQLFIYPVKSLGGIALNQAMVTDRGFQYDRRWMLIDENRQFFSQRDIPEMALMRLQIEKDGIGVNFSVKNSSFTIPFDPCTNEFAEVFIWEDTCRAQFVSNLADQWFSEMLEKKCRLVYMPEGTGRITDQHYAPAGSITSFADAYPFLLIGQSSLDDLNSRLKEALPVNRFRPNIVFTGGEPFQEDAMHTFAIGHITFHGVKLCARCLIITIDQATARQGKEPLKTLAGYRSKNNKILFGQNLVHEGLGEIRIGDQLQVLKLNEQDHFVVGVV
jgi:uncharacterized protein